MASSAWGDFDTKATRLVFRKGRTETQKKEGGRHLCVRARRTLCKSRCINCDAGTTLLHRERKGRGFSLRERGDSLFN